jgi:hypothetical protein
MGQLIQGTGADDAGVIASSSETEALTSFRVAAAIRVDEIRGAGSATVARIRVPNKFNIGATVFSDGTDVQIFVQIDTDNSFSGTLPLSSLPANGGYVVLVLSATDNGGTGNAIRAHLTALGGSTPLLSVAHASNWAGPPTTSGSGEIRLENFSGIPNRKGCRWQWAQIKTGGTIVAADYGPVAIGTSGLVGSYAIDASTTPDNDDQTPAGGTLAYGSGTWAAGGATDPAAFAGALTVDAAESTTIVQGNTATVAVTITRTAPFTGDATITATGLSAGVTAAPLTITSGNTTGTMVLTATGSATIVTNDAWQVVASGSGIADATDDVTLTVTAAPAGSPPVMGEGTIVIVQPVAPALPEAVPFVAVSATNSEPLSSATGITLEFKKPGGTWAAKTATYDGRLGCFTWTPDAADIDTQGRGRLLVAGAAGRWSYNVEIVGADQRQSMFRAVMGSTDSVGFSPLKYLRSVLATSSSFLANAQTGTADFRNPANTATWVQGSFDASGNRTAVTFTAPNEP